MDQKEKTELEKKIQANAEAIKKAAESDSKEAEEFNKLQKSDQTLEDLRK